ncbi:MAG: ADP-glyceromanno-heptose 6-epimerase [Elusimicrobia bacterium]|nr:ADP-glyceromanno-heptose 6-epimerase [Elusimicrobiota bacterium]
MRILVTGGAGFIGSNLAIELESKGHDVVVLDDFSTGHFENLRGFAGDMVAADAVKTQDWVYRVGPVDSIFHQAAITDTTVTDQKRMMEVNVEAFRNVLHFAAESGAKRVVYASSAGVYGAGRTPMKESQAPEPLNVYAFSKRVMERVASDFQRENPSMKVVGLRYFNVYGPRETFKKAAASMIWQLSGQIISGKRPRIFKWGEQFRDFIYVKDVVAANLRALETENGGVYNVCTGKPTTFNKIIECIHQVLGTKLETEFFENPYNFYQNETLGDPSGAFTGLGFTAKFGIEDGIRDYLSGFKGTGTQDRTVTLRPDQVREAVKSATKST